ncbi:MAG: LemA family protein [Actinomycetes bacterium]
MAIVVIVLVLIVILAIIAGLQFNKLRRLDLQAQGAYAGIETLLTKRADLIPNLVETVSGAADFERGTMEAVTAARAQVSGAGGVAQTAAADGELTQALGRLFAVAEAYPQLTATANFRDLQAQLSSVEGELQFARQYYNDSVVQLNTALRTIPSMWFAGMAGVKERELYAEPDAERRSAPKVDFS